MKGKVFVGALTSIIASLFIAVMSISLDASAIWKKTGLIGDVNGDGDINVADIVTLSRHLNGTEKLDDKSVFRITDSSDYIIRSAGKNVIKIEADIQKADLDQNGTVEVFDLVQLRKVVIESVPRVEILKWEEELKTTTATTTTTTTTFVTTATTTIKTIDPLPKNGFIDPPLADMFGSMPSQGKVNLLIFYVDFPDCKFNYDPSVEEIERIGGYGQGYSCSKGYPCEQRKGMFYQ